MAMTDRLAADVWPGEVYAPGVAASPFLARVFITEHHIYVWTADPSGSGWSMPRLVVDEDHDQPVERNRGSFRGQFRMETDAGPVYVTRGGGCGCGNNPLKALSAPVGW